MKVSIWKNGKKIKTISANIGADGILVDKIRQPILIGGKKVRLGDTVGETTILPEDQDAPSFASREKVYKGEVDFFIDRYMGTLKMFGRPIAKGDWNIVKPYARYITVDMAHDSEDYEFPESSQGWHFTHEAVDALVKAGYSVSFKGVQIESSKDIPR